MKIEGVTLCKGIGKPVRKRKEHVSVKQKETEFWEKREKSQEPKGRLLGLL